MESGSRQSRPTIYKDERKERRCSIRHSRKGMLPSNREEKGDERGVTEVKEIKF